METQLSLFRPAPTAREDFTLVMKDISKSCDACRLGAVLHPQNRGIIWRGNLEARIAVISEAPGDGEMEKGLPLVGKSGQLWERWAKYINLDTKKDTFITNVVQCQPEKVRDKATDKLAQRAPHDDEIAACFGPRCLRVMRSMPNLEVVLTLGWVAARVILGGEPKSKTHENKWFKTSILPGVAIYCMVHPSFIVREPSQAKSEVVKKGLDQFRREYLELRKIPAIVKHMEEEERLELL
jgi:uracil-DNA glycosylase family 4